MQSSSGKKALTWKGCLVKTGSVTATTGSLKSKQTKEQHLIAMALLRRANSRKHFYHWKDSNEEIMAVMQEELSYYKVTLFKSEIPILSFLWSPLRPWGLSSKFTTNAIKQQQVITRGSCLISDFLASRTVRQVHFLLWSTQWNVFPHSKRKQAKTTSKQASPWAEGESTTEHWAWIWPQDRETQENIVLLLCAGKKMTLQTKVGRMLHLLTIREVPIRD